MVELLYKKETYQAIGICMNIHKELGMGFKESTYKHAMQIDLAEQNIPYKREKLFNVKYKGKILPDTYFADFVVHDAIIIEVKSAACITESHMLQTKSYLAASGYKLGLLINFGERSLTWKRIIL